jgi:hypothetical protein
VAVTLDARGVPALHGQCWNGITVRNIVRSTAYIGNLTRYMYKRRF